MRPRLIFVFAAVLCLGLGASALAGKLVTGAGHTLQLTAGAKPAKPKRATIVHLVTSDGTTSGQRSADEIRTIEVDLPGFGIVPGDISKCKQAALLDTHGTGCAPGSAVGFGTGTVDARPADPTPIKAKLAVYYGEHNLDTNNMPITGRPALLLEADALGARYVYAFDILGHGRYVLDAGPPPANGQLSAFEITRVDLILSKVFTSPSKCKHGSWPVSETYTYDSGAKLTATDKIPCKKK